MTIYQTLAEYEGRGEVVCLCTITSSEGSTPRRIGAKMLVLPDGSFQGTIGGGEMEGRVIAEALLAMQDGQPRTLSYRYNDPGRGDVGVCGGQMEVFVEPVFPPATLVLVGAGHVGQAVAHLAKWLGFRVVVSDDRPEFCTPETVPDADAFINCTLAELPNRTPINRSSYLVLTTRGMNVDVEGLPALLETSAAYIGVIGSRRRWTLTKNALLEKGVSAEKLERVRSPVGLELNAETPREIAISIMAEVIMLSRGGDGKPMTSAGQKNSAG